MKSGGRGERNLFAPLASQSCLRAAEGRRAAIEFERAAQGEGREAPPSARGARRARLACGFARHASEIAQRGAIFVREPSLRARLLGRPHLARRRGALRVALRASQACPGWATHGGSGRASERAAQWRALEPGQRAPPVQ